jgi:hypothetical protein
VRERKGELHGNWFEDSTSVNVHLPKHGALANIRKLANLPSISDELRDWLDYMQQVHLLLLTICASTLVLNIFYLQ